MSNRDEGEVILTIDKEYQWDRTTAFKPALVILGIIGIGIVVKILSADGMRGFVDDLAFGLMGIGVLLFIIALARPPWFGNNDVKYLKLSYTSEREYTEFKELK